MKKSKTSKKDEPIYIRPEWQDKKISAPLVEGKSQYPQITDFFATIYCALTFNIMAYSGLFGMMSILLFYAIWLPHGFYKGNFRLLPSKDMLAPAIFVGFCVLSVLWSDYRSISLRYGVEFASMVACVFIMSRLVSINAFIKGLTIGASVALIATLINGNYGMDYVSGDYALVGLFGSKNQVGFVAEIGVIASIVYLFGKHRPLSKFIYAFIPLGLCAVCLKLSSSASSVITLIIALGVMMVGYYLNKFPKRFRAVTLVLGIFIISTLTLFAMYIGWQDALLGIFGKDTTLTGRTYLWDEGMKVGSEDPILGHGYAAFWVPGQQAAEKYWFKFMIFGRSGFHFHNLYIQSFVDLGAIGFLLITSLIILNCKKSFGFIIKNGLSPTAILCLGFAFMFLTRAFVEVDFLGPFGIGPLLFFAILPRLAGENSLMKSKSV
ncbi:MAG: O-antigen ligase [Alphaproteobacteria bacterium]